MQNAPKGVPGGELVNPFDAFDGTGRQVSNGKPQHGGDRLTDLTDLTVNERGCTYRASVGVRARAALLPAYPFAGVKSVKCVKSPERSCGFVLPPGVKRGVNLTAGWWLHE